MNPDVEVIGSQLAALDLSSKPMIGKNPSALLNGKHLDHKPQATVSSADYIIVHGVKYIREIAPTTAMTPENEEQHNAAMTSENLTSTWCNTLSDTETAVPNHVRDQEFNMIRIDLPGQGVQSTAQPPASQTEDSTEVIASSYFDNLSSKPVRVTFIEPATFYVQKAILERFLGDEAFSKYRAQLQVGEEVHLEDVKPSSFSKLIRLFYLGNPDTALDVSWMSVAEIVDLHVTAGKFGHQLIQTKCLDAIYVGTSVEGFMIGFEKLYHDDHGDQLDRDAFKIALLAKIKEQATSGRPFVAFRQPGVSHNIDTAILARAARAGGDFAEDVAKVLFDFSVSSMKEAKEGEIPRANGPEPVAESTGNNPDTVAWQLPIRQPNPPRKRTAAANAQHRGITETDDNQQEDPAWLSRDVVNQQSGWDITPPPRSGWAETAPPSEADETEIDAHDQQGRVPWADCYNPNEFGWNTDLAGNHKDRSDGTAQLNNAFGPASNWLAPDEWAHAGPTAAGLARTISASEVANDGWSMNNHGRGDSWGATDTVQFQAVHVTKPSSNGVLIGSHAPDQYGAGTPQRHSFPKLPPVFAKPLSPHPQSLPPQPPHFPLPTSNPGVPNVHPDPIAASRTQRELNHPPFPMATPTVFPHPGDGPIGMPHHIPFYGYNRLVSAGNGMTHPTSPGMYGLAGRTMVATRDSSWDCTLFFKTGDIISNVVALYPNAGQPFNPYQAPAAPTAPATPAAGIITHMQGICRGRAGQFPTSYVREMNPPVFRNLATPFDRIPTTTKTAPPPAKAPPTPSQAKEKTCGNWGCGEDECRDCKGDEMVVSRRPPADANNDNHDHEGLGLTSWDDVDESGADKQPGYGWDVGEKAGGWKRASDRW